jgi:hypothetical protein
MIPMWYNAEQPAQEISTQTALLSVDRPVNDRLCSHRTTSFPARWHEKALLPLGQALDRLLLWNAYMIPMWYNAEQRLAWCRAVFHDELM